MPMRTSEDSGRPKVQSVLSCSSPPRLAVRTSPRVAMLLRCARGTRDIWNVVFSGRREIVQGSQGRLHAPSWLHRDGRLDVVLFVGGSGPEKNKLINRLLNGADVELLDSQPTLLHRTSSCDDLGPDFDAEFDVQ